MANNLDPKKLEKQIEYWYENNNEKAFNIIGKVFLVGLVVWIVYLLVSFLGSLKGFSFDPLLAIINSLILVSVVLIGRRQIRVLNSINNRLANLQSSTQVPVRAAIAKVSNTRKK
jgi:hypothetical protein